MDYDTSSFPLGSKDPRVLYKNAKNFDAAMNGLSLSWRDRLGRMRKSWRGIENEWNTFLATTGFELPPLIYADGAPLVVERSTQLVQRNGLLYSIRLPADFPVELSGNWDDDQPLMVYRNDQPLRQDLADQDGGKLVGWTRTELSEQIKDVNSALDGSSINVWEYASLVSSKPNPEDPTTWDWAPAVQAAVNYCNSEFPAKELVVPTMIRLASPVSIDRPVDGISTRDTFSIRGINGGGFYVDSAIAMFTTTIAQNIDPTGMRMPSSQNIKFENLKFTSSDSSLNAYILDNNKFLRVYIAACSISYLKLLKTESYIQSIYICPNNNIRYWSGTFIESNGGAFDIRATGSQIEHGENFWSTIDNTGNKSVSGCYIENCLIEGLSGFAILYSHVRGIAVTSCYFEGNGGPDIIGDSFPSTANLGVYHAGNMHSTSAANDANPAFYAVRWGYTFGGTSLGNFCSGRLNYVRSDTQITMNDAAILGISNTQDRLILNDIELGNVRPSDDPPAYGNRAWRAGSVVINKDHSSKGYAGWICVVPGTPGIWYPFGNNCDGESWNFTNIDGSTTMAKVGINEPSSGQTVLSLRYSNGTTVQLGRVLVGAADSAGTGYRTLRVAN
ncbi:hypothetical protein [Pseudomonas aeruginosa]|uniref:hypothetical protein n=1 Tax=Pseudomonas aeruginosa TaxID=287 RepID=UPI0030A0FF94|nr:hypothetical protein [Pseudomonas aeruginosa]